MPRPDHDRQHRGQDAVLPRYRALLERLQSAGLEVPASATAAVTELEAELARRAAAAAATGEPAARIVTVRAPRKRRDPGEDPLPSAEDAVVNVVDGHIDLPSSKRRL